MALTINILVGNLQPHLWETNADSISFVKGALEANGINVKLGVDHVDEDAINLFFDRFYVNPKLPLQLKAAKIKYGIVCTESISSDGVWNFEAEGADSETHIQFQIAAKNAEFIWCQLSESLEACRAMNSNSAQLKYGYLESLKNLVRAPPEERDIDILMSGMPSPRRTRIIETLRNAGYRSCYPGLPVPVYIRNGLSARTQLGLSLQKTDKHQIDSVTRICHSVINQIPLLLETKNSSGVYSGFCLCTTGENIVEDVRKHLLETDLEAWTNEQYEKLADEMPMQKFMADLIIQTINID